MSVEFKEADAEETRCRALTSLSLTSSTMRVLEEYLDSINAYLAAKDASNGIARDYMKGQKDINAKMRTMLIDWLVEVHLKFELLPQTVFSCVQLLDRFLERQGVERSRLQLVGVCCLMIASKLEEVYSPVAADYLAVCDGAYSRAELLEMEGEILQAVGFNVLCPTSYNFLMGFNAKVQLEEKLLFYAQYLLETALLDTACLKHGGPLLAASAIFFTNKVFKREGWSADNERLTGISEGSVKVAAKDLFVVMQRVDKSQFGAVAKKFSDPQFFEASKYTIQKGGN